MLKKRKFISSFPASLDLLSYYSVHVVAAQKRKDNSLPYGQFVGRCNKFLKMALGSDSDWHNAEEGQKVPDA